MIFHFFLFFNPTYQGNPTYLLRRFLFFGIIGGNSDECMNVYQQISSLDEEMCFLDLNSVSVFEILGFTPARRSLPLGL